MPSNILTTDTSFPQLTEEQSNDEKFGVITNYLYMLLEQLRYSMANLGRENFNDAEFDSIANIITEPVYVQLEGVEGEVASLQLTAQSLTQPHYRRRGEHQHAAADLQQPAGAGAGRGGEHLLPAGDGTEPDIPYHQRRGKHLLPDADCEQHHADGEQRGVQQHHPPADGRRYHIQQDYPIQRHGDVLRPGGERNHIHQRGQHPDGHHPPPSTSPAASSRVPLSDPPCNTTGPSAEKSSSTTCRTTTWPAASAWMTRAREPSTRTATGCSSIPRAWPASTSP